MSDSFIFFNTINISRTNSSKFPARSDWLRKAWELQKTLVLKKLLFPRWLVKTLVLYFFIFYFYSRINVKWRVRRNRCGHRHLISISYASSMSLLWPSSCSSVDAAPRFGHSWEGSKDRLKSLVLGSWQVGWFLWRSSCNNLIVSSLTRAAMESGLELNKCNVPLQVRGGLCRNILRPHHAVPAAGERRGGRHLPGGQDDQSHEARSLHRHGELSVIMSTDVFSPLWSSPLLILKLGLSALTH